MLKDVMKSVPWVAALAVFALCGVAHADRNLVANGDFSQARADNPNLPAAWTPSKGSDAMLPDKTQPNPEAQVKTEWAQGGRNGGRCISVYTDNRAVMGGWTSNPIAVKPNTFYLLRFYYKCDVAGKGPGGFGILDAHGKNVREVYLGESTLWTRLECEFDAGNTQSLQISFGLYHRQGQRYFFDDVELIETSSIPVIESPANRSISASAMPAISWKAPAGQGAFAVSLSQNPEFPAADTVVVKGIEDKKYVPAQPLSDGTWFIRVTGAGADGEVHTSKSVSVLINPGNAGRGKTLDTTPPMVWGYSPVADCHLAESPAKISFQCDDGTGGSGIDPASAKMIVDGQAVAADSLPLNGNRIECALKNVLPPGIHTVTVSVSDKAGNSSGAATWGFFVQSNAPDRVDVETGLLRVNGRPFYPVGIYAHSYSESAAVVSERAARSGFNVFWGGVDLSANNLRTLWNVHFERSPAELEKSLSASLAEPGALGTILFHIADEPEDMAPEQMERVHSAIKKMDPNHPTGWILCIPETYSKFASSDLLLEDHYPVMPSPPGCTCVSNYLGVGEAIDLLRKAGKDRKPVLAVIQAFDWRMDRGERIKPADHRPTEEEIFLMCAVAAIHEANGIILYPAGDSVLLDRLMPIAGKLRYLSPALLAPSLPKACRVTTGAEIIKAVAKPAPEGSVYVISVNPTLEPVLGGFSFDRTINEVRVMFENRTIDPAGRSFSDVFAPTATHLYLISFK